VTAAQDRFFKFQRDRMLEKPTTAREIIDALRKRFGNAYMRHRWAKFEEFRVGTGFGRGAEQRVDLWVMGMWQTNRMARIAYEVKMSRSDFRRELAQPTKRRQALLISNEFWFAAPFDVIPPDEVPLECGLVEFGYVGEGERRRLEHIVTVDAPWRDTPPPSWGFVAALCRRVEAESAVAASGSGG